MRKQKVFGNDMKSNDTSIDIFNFGNYVRSIEAHAAEVERIKRMNKIKQSQPWKRKGKNVK